MTTKEYYQAIEMNDQIRYCGEMLRHLSRRGWIWERQDDITSTYLRNLLSTLDDDMRSVLIKYYADKLANLQKEQVELLKENE